MMLETLIILSFINWGLCADHSVRPRIVGGVSAKIEDNNWQVAIETGATFKCGGIVLSQNFILTSAQCVDGLPPAALTVRHSTADSLMNGFEMPVVKVNRHPMAGPVANLWDFNVAILTLEKRLTLSAYVGIISLSEKRIQPGVRTFLTGWGANQQGATLPSSKLQSLEVQVNTCDLTQYPDYISVRMFCASVSGSKYGACTGDEGGPLVERSEEPVLVGITSYVGSCGTNATVFMYPGALREWIMKATDNEAIWVDKNTYTDF